MDSKAIKRSDLVEGQRFWNFKPDVGDPEVESIIKNGSQVWADGTECECVSLSSDSCVFIKA